MSDNTIDDVSVRMTALDMAIRSETHGSSIPPATQQVVDRAETYRAFLQGEL